MTKPNEDRGSKEGAVRGELARQLQARYDDRKVPAGNPEYWLKEADAGSPGGGVDG